MKDFRTLQVWEKGHLFVLEIYKITAQLPKEELFGLTSQLRRAAASIPTNIAEGCGRGSQKDFARFLQIAIGSASETSYLLLLIADLNYASKEEIEILLEKVNQIMKMLAALLKTIRNS